MYFPSQDYCAKRKQKKSHGREAAQLTGKYSNIQNNQSSTAYEFC